MSPPHLATYLACPTPHTPASLSCRALIQELPAQERSCLGVSIWVPHLRQTLLLKLKVETSFLLEKVTPCGASPQPPPHTSFPSKPRSWGGRAHTENGFQPWRDTVTYEEKSSVSHSRRAPSPNPVDQSPVLLNSHDPGASRLTWEEADDT